MKIHKHDRLWQHSAGVDGQTQTRNDNRRCGSRAEICWAFEFPPGWRGRLIQTVPGRLFVTGPSAALARLKQAAEHRW